MVHQNAENYLYKFWRIFLLFSPNLSRKRLRCTQKQLHPQTQVKGLPLQISPIWTWSRNHAVFCYYTITDMKQWKTNTFNNSEIWDHRETWKLWNTPPKTSHKQQLMFSHENHDFYTFDIWAGNLNKVEAHHDEKVKTNGRRNAVPGGNIKGAYWTKLSKR